MLNPAVAAKWVANSPVAMVDQYTPNLKSIQNFDASLTKPGITSAYDTFEGDHANHLHKGIEEKVLPFFVANLAFSQPKR